MVTNSIANYLKYANLQMAAEAILWPEGKSAKLDKDILKYGNNHVSKFTDTLATEYADSGWTILDHKKNTSTGFSATLFKYTGEDNEAKGWKSGECVISFRSTEFIDDAVNDCQDSVDAVAGLLKRTVQFRFASLAPYKTEADCAVRARGSMPRPAGIFTNLARFRQKSHRPCRSEIHFWPWPEPVSKSWARPVDNSAK